VAGCGLLVKNSQVEYGKIVKALRCPICQSAFQQNQQGVVCVNRHQFDRSKEGYFNLLPVQNKNSLTPGDAKEQLEARREFLQSGFFDPLKSKILSLMGSSSKSVLDLGCGEGYFTRALATHLPDAEVYGVDIAKAGIAMAAKAAKSLPSITHFVASNFDLPLQDHSMDTILRILAPSKDSELQRVLNPDGKLLIVIPGEQHLIGLRKKIYADIRQLQSLPEIEGFVLTETTNVQFSIELNQSEQVQSLLSMTPFSWKVSAKLRSDIVSSPFEDQSDFLINIYNRITT
jgi:23S rRNA (guanine745-N1)-methyltransferase